MPAKDEPPTGGCQESSSFDSAEERHNTVRATIGSMSISSILVRERRNAANNELTKNTPNVEKTSFCEIRLMGIPTKFSAICQN
jgi:hypothetical protein